MKLFAILLAASTVPLGAQWLNYPEAWTPHTRDGKPNLTAPAPRMNGKPDLSGVWQAERTLQDFAKVFGPEPTKLQVDLNDVTKYAADLFWGIKPEEQPLRPEAAAVLRSAKTCFLRQTAVCPLEYPPAYLFSLSK